MPDNTLNAISKQFGPSLVSVGGGRRVSFADAWRDGDATLRERAIHIAFHSLTREQRAAGKAPSVANERVAMLTQLLRKLLLMEDGGGFRVDGAAMDQ